MFTQVRKHYMLSLLPAMAIWKDGRISIEIASLGDIARSKSGVWMNPYSQKLGLAEKAFLGWMLYPAMSATQEKKFHDIDNKC